MHSTGVAIVSLLVAATSVRGISVEPWVATAVLALAVAVVGVPHGGLDHLTGRRLLRNRFPKLWVPIFFTVYLLVAACVLVGWSLSPSLTAVTFFLLSAWHFGVEDQMNVGQRNFRHHFLAIAVGGLVIWIPSLFQPANFLSAIETVIVSEIKLSAASVLQMTQWIAMVAVPIAIGVTALDLASGLNVQRSLRNISLGTLFATADVLISFGIYFCGWHSIRGLQSLAREHDKSFRQLFWSVLPLSTAAVVMAGAGMWFWSSGQVMSDAVSRTLFLSLSAIAVPHLLLHGPIAERLSKSLQEDTKRIDDRCVEASP